MNKSFGQIALYGLLAIILFMNADGMAQETGATIAVPPPGCAGEAGCEGPQTTVSVMGGPVIGAGHSLGWFRQAGWPLHCKRMSKL